MREFLVTWTIDIEADNPTEAAARALIIQRDNDPANTATVFNVSDKETGKYTEVDLTPEAAEESTAPKVATINAPASPTQYGVTVKVTPQQIADLIISEFEHNSMATSWIAKVRAIRPTDKEIVRALGKGNGPWYADPRLYDKASEIGRDGFSMTVWEIEDESVYEGDLPKDGKDDLPDGLKKHEGIDLMRLLRGFEIMAEKSPYQFGQFLADNADAITADVWFQCVVLGDVVYG